MVVVRPWDSSMKKNQAYRYIVSLSFSVLILGLFFTPSVYASPLGDTINAQLNAGAGSAGYDTARSTDLRILLPSLIQTALSLLGIVYLVLVFMAGYNLLTARGEEEKVTKAKGALKRGTIGLLVVFLSYSIANFVGNIIERTIAP